MKNFTLLILMALAMMMPAQAECYFTMGENGTLRISPVYISGTVYVPVRLHLGGRIDSWTVSLTYPSDLVPTGFAPSTDVNSIPYQKSDGEWDTYQAVITNSGLSVFSSTITDFGYWDYNNDGIYEPYGTIKWEAGNHDNMFLISFTAMSDCTGDSITLDANLSSTYDWRGGTDGGQCFRRVLIKFGYKLGDVNGDELINITDVNYLNNSSMHDFVNLDSYQAEAADINGDGQLNQTDITLLINLINSTNGFEGLMELYDDPIASILGNSGTLPF